MQSSSNRTSSTRPIPFELSDGTTVRIETTLSGEQKVSSLSKQSFREMLLSIQSLSSDISSSLRTLKNEAKPTKMAVKFGLEVALESGQLTTVLVKGSGKANLEITLEWSN